MKQISFGLGAWLGATLFFSACPLLANDWPQWRGPKRDGVSKETGLLKEWPKEGPKLLWQRKDIGFGYSTPSIVGERLYVLSNRGTDNEFVQALALKDGQQVWTARLGKVGTNTPQYPFPGARSTPTVDGEVLYALSSDGDLACVELAAGKVRWQKNLKADFGGKPGDWAYSESPLVDGDAVVCTPGGSAATLVALNKKNGEVIWKSSVPGDETAAYASIIVVEASGVKQYVQLLQKGLVAVEAKTGKVLWRYAKPVSPYNANIPTPVTADGYVYSSAAGKGGGVVKVKASGGNVEAEEIYFSPKMPTVIGGTVKVGDSLYGATQQGLLCAEFKTGDVKWQDKCVGPASLCYADGRLYVHGEAGEVALVEATAESYREKGRFAPPDQPERGRSKAWAYPVVANGRLYVRDLDLLWCYDVKAK